MADVYKNIGDNLIVDVYEYFLRDSGSGLVDCMRCQAE